MVFFPDNFRERDYDRLVLLFSIYTGLDTRIASISDRHFDELSFLNKVHADKHPYHDELESRMQSYELAYRMQMEVPGVIDLACETEKTKEAYGLNQKETAEFGKQCLMARRLVEKGVRAKSFLVAGIVMII